MAHMLTADYADKTLEIVFTVRSLPGHVLITLIRCYSGMLIGAFFGIVLGLLAGQSRQWHLTFKYSVIFLGLVPIGTLLLIGAAGTPLFGPLLGTKGIIISASIAVFSYVASGTCEMPHDPEYKQYVEAALVDGATSRQISFKIIPWVAKPAILSFLCLGLLRAILMTLYAETVISPDGVGLLLYTMMTDSRFEELYAVSFISIALAIPGLVVLALLWRESRH
jgi:ABC-type nitrate/sulfonate/bicarbonate transport system permease component